MACSNYGLSNCDLCYNDIDGEDHYREYFQEKVFCQKCADGFIRTLQGTCVQYDCKDVTGCL